MTRCARILIAVGALLLAMTAAAFAQDPTPTPTPAPSPVPTATAVPEPTVTITAAPSPAPTASPSPAPSASPSPAPTASPSPAPSATPTPSSKARQSPTPPPEPTPTPPDQFTGASLTICHWTGSEYVPVTITADQYSGYFDLPLDIIPAPASGCAGIDPATAANQDVTVCHRNPDGTFTLLRYPAGDLGGHEGDQGDLIPAPNGTCPGLDPGAVAVTPTPSPSPGPSPTAEPPADGDVIGEATATPKRTRPLPPVTRAVVKSISLGATAPPAPPVATATVQQLPFTGLDLGLIAGLGIAFVLSGTGLRLVAAAQPPFGVTR